MKEILFAISLLTCCSIGFSQDYSYGQKLCQKYIQDGKSSTENKVDNGNKTGYWTFYYDRNDSIVENLETVTSFQIIKLKKNSPIGLGCFCSAEGRFEGYSKYLNDTNWILDSTSVWFDSKGRVESKSTYRNDTVIKFEGFTSKGYLYTSEDYLYPSNDSITILKIYRSNGSIIIYEEQLNGVDHGNYKIYYPNGNIKVDAIYVNGFRIMDTIYFKNGSPKVETKCSLPEEPCDCVKYNKAGNKIIKYQSKSIIVEKWTR